jgi:S1-C subfamily serine protease
VERSEPDDDAVGGDAYPPAPLPAHERTWRHPSELGRAVWVHNDPPITIGRGLLLTTGAIGGLLSLAVLWAMLPSAGRGGVAGPTVVTSTANDALGPGVTARPDTLVATSVDARVPSTTFHAAPSTIPASQQAATTTTAASQQPPATDQTEGSVELVEGAPVAVGIGDSLVVTTARAARGHSFLTLTDAQGHRRDATVLMVDNDLGLAVLSADAAGMTTSYGLGPAASPGDVVTVAGPSPVSANVGINAEGHLTLDAWGSSMVEGTPVLNTDGLLVGICSHGASGPELVSVVNVGAMLPPAKPAQVAAWLGVKVTTGDQGALVVDRVDPDGPAAAVGIVVGDIITAVDGAAVTDRDGLKATIAAHAPADVVTLTVTHVDQTSGDIQVTLGTAPSM